MSDNAELPTEYDLMTAVILTSIYDQITPTVLGDLICEAQNALECWAGMNSLSELRDLVKDKYDGRYPEISIEAQAFDARYSDYEGRASEM